jgi:salicylate hydroxylase
VGLWQLRDLDPLPTWVRGRAIIVGDAAHPSKRSVFATTTLVLTSAIVLPHQAGGALSAIEDAEALGQFLSGTTRNTVHEDLLHVFRVRFKRTAQFQLRSRTDGLYKAAPPVPHAEQMRRWDYIGAARWESEHADMVLRDGEEAVYTLEP